MKNWKKSTGSSLKAKIERESMYKHITKKECKHQESNDIESFF